MNKKYKKIIIFFSLLFCLSFLYSSFCFALEIDYPTIKGVSLDSSTKFPDFVAYLFNAGVFLGFFAAFISILIAGSLYFLSPAIPSALAMAKDRISGAVSGVLILALTYLIVTTIYPQLSVFSLGELRKVTTGDEQPIKSPGVYLSNFSGCPDNISPFTTSVPDLGSLKGGIISAYIEQGTNENNLYVSTLFSSFNYYGECEDIAPNAGCQSNNNFAFANSISIHKYDTSPNGNGVRIYRKPFFNEDGGYYDVSNSEISNIFQRNLNELNFGNGRGNNCNVPKEEQDCIKYDSNGLCTERSCPTLANDNIGSIELRGSYVVVLVYFNPDDHLAEGKITDSHWNFCQEFPSPDDVNKSGPQQIQWRNITNHNKNTPNYIVIYPVQES